MMINEGCEIVITLWSRVNHPVVVYYESDTIK